MSTRGGAGPVGCFHITKENVLELMHYVYTRHQTRVSNPATTSVSNAIFLSMRLPNIRDFVLGQRWTRMSILNTAGSYKFSSDRTIHEYAKDIWNIKPVEIA